MSQLTKNTEYYRTEKILGVRVDFVDLEKILLRVEEWVKSNKQYQITTPNPEHIILAQKDYRFRNIINKSALAIADGIGVVWALRLLKHQWKNIHRLSGIDLMTALCKLGRQKKWRVFLLGAKKDVARKAAENIKRIILAQCKD